MQLYHDALLIRQRLGFVHDRQCNSIMMPCRFLGQSCTIIILLERRRQSLPIVIFLELHHRPFGETEVKLHRRLHLRERKIELHNHRHLGAQKQSSTIVIVIVLETRKKSCTIIVILERRRQSCFIVVIFGEVEMKLHHCCHLKEVEVELHRRHPLRVAPSSFRELEVEMYYHHHA
ncbi:histidine-rich glycoprotein-like [Cucumis melo var. makuwa]|uniref:Histidine-rich glycoprotein-like n=1 Tax=Cucumis melo var. makuwa TaxID=1194695 RepID=A0A5D3BL12_CUCMM|nr:histidine-rich glycoprotein-like [Cucumis melo var. makuwa]